ncbi:hypothetical protein [Stygiolobus azoricus]|uniref:Uncharacterized protein n=1 Tax=Stygiolobus azoricus TaxID=41675 RepID=A0A650CQN3_9CREN|nr:hypothetical protein [Stygiolobus azoricus]QGR20150.1 hypothetical protein D1868_09240 [Stygiolobus azoricus]
MENFWMYYRGIEKGTKVTYDEFISDHSLKSEVLNSIKNMYNLIRQEVKKRFGIGEIRLSDAIWELAKRKIIKSELIQEYLDVLEAVEKIDMIDDFTIYTMLVRIMEDLEELYFSVIKFKTD